MTTFTIELRPDGTIHGVTKTEQLTFTGPNGETIERPHTAQSSTEELQGVLGPAYAAFDAHNRELEKRIAADAKAIATLQKTADSLLAALQQVQQAEAAWNQAVGNLLGPAGPAAG